MNELPIAWQAAIASIRSRMRNSCYMPAAVLAAISYLERAGIRPDSPIPYDDEVKSLFSAELENQYGTTDGAQRSHRFYQPFYALANKAQIWDLVPPVARRKDLSPSISAFFKPELRPGLQTTSTREIIKAALRLASSKRQ